MACALTQNCLLGHRSLENTITTMSPWRPLVVGSLSKPNPNTAQHAGGLRMLLTAGMWALLWNPTAATEYGCGTPIQYTSAIMSRGFQPKSPSLVIRPQISSQPVCRTFPMHCYTPPLSLRLPHSPPPTTRPLFTSSSLKFSCLRLSPLYQTPPFVALLHH